MVCSHRHLEAIEPMFTGVEIDVVPAQKSPWGGVTGMFTFRPCRCTDCGAVITILEAIVSQPPDE